MASWGVAALLIGILPLGAGVLGPSGSTSRVPGPPGYTSGVPVSGRVLGPGGEAVEGVFVTAARDGGGLAVTVLSDEAGIFRIPDLASGSWSVRAHTPGWQSPSRELEPAADDPLTLTLRSVDAPGRDLPASELLAMLPDGETKRRFVLDCTGCHPFSAEIAAPGGSPRSEDDWSFWIERMLSFAGQESPFPIIGERDPEATAKWLAAHSAKPRASPSAPGRPGTPAGVVLTEYELPLSTDLPHDLALDSAGGVLVTGMMSHRLYRLTPAAAEWEIVPIPVQGANPRAVEVAPDGRWWVALGFPHRIAVHDPSSGGWESWEVGVHPHDLVLAEDGSVWVNGHFSVGPEVVKRLDPETGEVRAFELAVDGMPYGGSTIPYGFRRGPNGELWMTQLLGNRLLRLGLDGDLRARYDLPTAHAGPRRLDVSPDGTVWIPEYAAGRLARFDPASERFEEIPFPTADALPYVARVDPAAGTVWVGTAASNTLGRWDHRNGCWIELPLPHPAALVRHLAIDPLTGDVWGSYAPSPSLRPAVFRVQVPARTGC